MLFDIVTIFPAMFEPALKAGVVGRAIERGTVTFVPITNPLAYRLKQRMGDRNLNRNMAPSAIPQDFEDRIANVLCPLLDAHDVLLDLHSFHTGGARRGARSARLADLYGSQSGGEANCHQPAGRVARGELGKWVIG